MGALFLGLHPRAFAVGGTPSPPVDSDITTMNVTTTAMTGGSGQLAYISAAGVASPTDNANQLKSEFVGVYEGVPGNIVLTGPILDMQFTTAGGSPTNGEEVYVAAAADDTNTGAGKATATAPTATGSTVRRVGICVSNANYASAKTCQVALSPAFSYQNP